AVNDLFDREDRFRVRHLPDPRLERGIAGVFSEIPLRSAPVLPVQELLELLFPREILGDFAEESAYARRAVQEITQVRPPVEHLILVPTQPEPHRTRMGAFVHGGVEDSPYRFPET